MTKIRYQSTENVRKFAHNVSEQFYSNDEINEIIDRWSIRVHNDLGQTISTAFTSADEIFETVRSMVLYGAGWEILNSIDGMEENARQAMDMYKSTLEGTEEGASSVVAVASHYDLIDGIDEDHYGQQF